jgi:hypothetical protein
MQYPFWYVLAHRRGERYDLTPLYIGGVHIYGLYGSSAQPFFLLLSVPAQVLCFFLTSCIFF